MSEMGKQFREWVLSRRPLGCVPVATSDEHIEIACGELLGECNIYDFGDGSTYPEYKQSMRVEAAFTTKRSGIFRFSYDTKQLIIGSMGQDVDIKAMAEKIGTQQTVAALSQTTMQLPVRIGDVIIPDVAGTGVDVVATANQG